MVKIIEEYFMPTSAVREIYCALATIQDEATGRVRSRVSAINFSYCTRWHNVFLLLHTIFVKFTSLEAE